MSQNKNFIGEQIKSLRMKKNMSMEKLAQTVDVSSTTIYRIEKGQEPGANNLKKIAEALGVSTDKLLGLEAEKTLEERKVDLKVIPVLGKICAGEGIEVLDQNTIDYVSIAGGKADFALIVKGDSMSPKYKSGDIVLIIKQNDLQNGEIGAICYNGHDAVIRKFVQEDNTVYLNAINSDYPPITLTGERLKSLKIYGKVVGKISWDV